MQLREEPRELRRAEAMAHFIRLREQKQLPVEEALERTAFGVLIGAQQKPLSKEQLRRWLQLFISNDGRITPSLNGAHRKTESFLSDNDLRAEARAWLRANCRAAKPKGDAKAGPLNPRRFREWVNETLLKDILAEPGCERKGISHKTAVNWMHSLGFDYERHKKGMYFDGHERGDVVIDRDEKMVMLQVLAEVLVTFEGPECETVVWPSRLLPGEPPLVLVSQVPLARHARARCARAPLPLHRLSYALWLLSLSPSRPTHPSPPPRLSAPKNRSLPPLCSPPPAMKCPPQGCVWRSRLLARQCRCWASPREYCRGCASHVGAFCVSTVFRTSVRSTATTMCRTSGARRARCPSSRSQGGRC